MGSDRKERPKLSGGTSMTLFFVLNLLYAVVSLGAIMFAHVYGMHVSTALAGFLAFNYAVCALFGIALARSPRCRQ